MGNVFSVGMTLCRAGILLESLLRSLDHVMNELHNNIDYRRIECNRLKDEMGKHDVSLIYVPTDMEV